MLRRPTKLILLLMLSLGVGYLMHTSPAVRADWLNEDFDYSQWDPDQLGLPAFAEAISRPVTVYNVIADGAGETANEVISRSVTVYNAVADDQGQVIAEAVSRSVTVYNAVADDQGQEIAEAHSRGVTVCNLGVFVDDDGDGVHDCVDLCPGFPDSVDDDGDGIPNGCDLCPTDPGPSIAMQPGDATICQGETATFTVTASGTPTLAYQWRHNNVAIIGANGDTFVINSAQPIDAGAYDCVVTNLCGAETSGSATLTVVILSQCVDTNQCTLDSCSGGVCSNAPTPGEVCDDGDPCTENDLCDGAAACAGTAIDCDDMNECTADACVDGKCENVPQVDQMCSDGSACTENDRCDVLGACVGTAVNCNDNNVCTNDSCDTLLGCQNVNHTDPCDDGNPCTVDDACDGMGACAGTMIVQLWGDVRPPGGNGIINLDDILCILNGFSNPSSCPGADIVPCSGNGIVNLDDILAILAAFSGNNACPHPCPP